MERRAILDTVKQKIDADYRSRLGQWEEEFYQDDVGFLEHCPLPAKIDRKKVKKRNESQVYSVMLLYAASQSRRRFSKSRGGSQPREEWGRMVL